MAAEAQRMKLPASIDLDVMDEVRDWLVEATGQGAVRLDGSAVGRCATNALLMLLSAEATARKYGFSLTIEQPSAALEEAVARVGMAEMFSGILRKD